MKTNYLRPRRQLWLMSLTVFFLLVLYWRVFRAHETHERTFQEGYTQTLVLARTTWEDTSWIAAELPSLQQAVYVVDDPNAALPVPTAKGHETMVYLTYIIDHYHNLSDVTIFTHAQREAWHNNALQELDLVEMLRSLSSEHVVTEGFFNLRCDWESGCPSHLFPKDPLAAPETSENRFIAYAWPTLHSEPNDPELPDELAAPCSSQFAASRDTLRSIPLARWERYRTWLLETKIPDHISGRIWESTWHHILTGKSVLCPPAEECYCAGYGLCFESGAEIKAWLAMREAEWLGQLMLESEQLGEDGKRRIEDRLAFRMTRPLEQGIKEAKWRGDDPVQRARLSGKGAL